MSLALPSEIPIEQQPTKVIAIMSGFLYNEVEGSVQYVYSTLTYSLGRLIIIPEQLKM